MCNNVINTICTQTQSLVLYIQRCCYTVCTNFDCNRHAAAQTARDGRKLPEMHAHSEACNAGLSLQKLALGYRARGPLPRDAVVMHVKKYPLPSPVVMVDD